MTDESTGFSVYAPMLGIGLLIGLGASTATAQDCGATRDLALVNGQIYQMNETDSTASSVLIKNGRIVTATDDYFADVYIEGETVKQIGQLRQVTHLSTPFNRFLDISSDCEFTTSGRPA